jgi:hypothetical protein
MLAFCGGTASYRKLQLFACACCRRIWSLIASAQARRVVEVAERIADGQATDEEGLRESAHLAWEQTGQAYSRVRGENVAALAGEAASRTLSDVRSANVRALQARCEQALVENGLGGSPTDEALSEAQEAAVVAASNSEELEQARLLRDVVKPFHPVAFASRWRSADVTGLAQGVYEDRAFDRLPFLADALMDSGCDDEDILAHCRSEGPHVRGCWVVDLVLGKK